MYCSAKEIAGDRADDFERLALTLNGVIKRSKEDSVGLQPEKFSGYQILKKGELVFKLIDLENVATSRVGLSPYTGIVSPAYIVLSKQSRAKDLVVRYSMYHFLSMWQREIFNQMGDNGVRSSLNTKELLNIPHPFPSVCEQKRIVTFLDAQCAEIDTVLEKTRASIEEYKKLKQAVITQAVTKGIFDKQIYPHNVKLKYLLYIASGDAIRNEELSEVGKYPAYGGGESLGFASKYNTLENSLIVGRVGARCGCVTYIDSKAWATDNALIVHPICNPRYMYYMLIYSQLNNLNTSNAQPLITATKIKNVVVPYFLEDTCQRKIVDFLDEKCACIDAIIEKKQQYLTEIENYKKSLIYEYVTGKKEVV